MTLNNNFQISKTKFQIKVNGKRLFPSSFIKYLGVYPDSKFSWDKHIHELSIKLKRANSALCKLRHYVPESTLKSIYYSIFSSHVTYGCQLWGLNDNTTTHRILLLQKAALRIMSFSSFRTPSRPLFFKFNILTIFDHVKLLNILFLFQHLKFELPPEIINTLQINNINHRYSTRGKTLGNLVIPYMRTKNYGTFSLIYQAINTWNFLQSKLNIQYSDLSISKI